MNALTAEQRRSLRAHAEVQVGTTYERILALLDQVEAQEAELDSYKAELFVEQAYVAELQDRIAKREAELAALRTAVPPFTQEQLAWLTDAGWRSPADVADLHRSAQALLDLKRGPRDSAYYARKQGAWDALAQALGGEQ